MYTLKKKNILNEIEKENKRHNHKVIEKIKEGDILVKHKQNNACSKLCIGKVLMVRGFNNDSFSCDIKVLYSEHKGRCVKNCSFNSPSNEISLLKNLPKKEREQYNKLMILEALKNGYQSS